ncbi:hypothetical protein I4U23_011789 [Adineta vaga]|nr:hypothetical protein I4U23_011789 [Adineta vaga]
MAKDNTSKDSSPNQRSGYYNQKLEDMFFQNLVENALINYKDLNINFNTSLRQCSFGIVYRGKHQNLVDLYGYTLEPLCLIQVHSVTDFARTSSSIASSRTFNEIIQSTKNQFENKKIFEKFY